MVYRNANHRNGGTYVTPDSVLDDIKFYLDKAREFNWRNTNMKLNLQFTYYDIDEYKNFGDAGAFESVTTTGDHLENDFGVVNTQFDLVFRISPSTGGYYSVGTTDLLELAGPQRKTGFSQLQWPLSETGIEKYPYDFGDEVHKEMNDLIWLFLHESQHVIDAIYRDNGHPEMGHGDKPEEYSSYNYPQILIHCALEKDMIFRPPCCALLIQMILMFTWI